VTRLGIAVGQTVVRAVVIARGRLVWAAERAWTGPEDLRGALGALAAERPEGIRRARVALEPDVCHIKLLRQLPRLSAARLERAVALQAGRWFLRNGAALVTGATWVRRGGPVLAAAAEHGLVEAIGDGLASAGLHLDGVHPAAPLAAGFLPDGTHRRSLGGLHEELQVRAGRLEGYRRHLRTDPDNHLPLTIPGLAEDHRAYATAYAAAYGGLAPDLRPVDERLQRVRRRRTLAQVLVVAVLAWAAAGGVLALRTRRTTERAAATLTRLGPALDGALATQRDLQLATEVLAIIEAARHRRSQDGVLLAYLTAALPDSAYLVALTRGKDDRVTLVGYAPSAARVLAALAASAGVQDAAFQGPVTRETATGLARERFAVAFRWQPQDLGS
jgi:Tfp pilus assembly protein PilN